MDISSLRERSAPKPLAISELNQYIKRIFDGDRVLSAVSVRGEISNFVNHRSGHFYFSLKDEEGQIRAVMFRSSAMKLKFIPENGMKVVVHGSVSVYTRDGSYQMYVNSMEPDGIGALYLAYEKLKERLSIEGLFDEWHKKPLPKIPLRVGVITSPTGAAVRDIINVAGRRFPLAKIYLYPSLVQGDGAEDNLIKAIDYFEDTNLVDVIIIGRGGGSIEDLWAFNGERLARRIYSAETPVISAVGHETDFTICDFVSDMRAPTPSAAAELAVPDINELKMRISGVIDRSTSALVHIAERKRERLNIITEKDVLTSPLSIISPKREEIVSLFASLLTSANKCLSDKRSVLSLNAAKLDALSPLAVLARGYSIVQRDNKILTDADSICLGDEISITLTKGSIVATVNDVKREGL